MARLLDVLKDSAERNRVNDKIILPVLREKVRKELLKSKKKYLKTEINRLKEELNALEGKRK